MRRSSTRTALPPRSETQTRAALAVLCATEMWERFAFYGLRSLLIAYLLQVVLPLGGHAAGLAPLGRVLAHAGGPGGQAALASRIYGLYTGLIYLLPLLGGFVADRWLPRSFVVALGAATMAASLLAMMQPAWCLPALLLLCLGTGLLKGNISVQVGALFPHDERRRNRAYAIFYLGINVGAFLGPITCGALALRAGWNAGFGASAAAMLVALATYVAARGRLPAPVVKRGPPLPAGATPSRNAWAGLLLVGLAAVCLSSSYEQQGNAMVRWLSAADPSRALRFAWLQSIPSLVVLLGTPPLAMLWARAGRHAGRSQMLTGAAITVASQLLLGAIAALDPGAPPIAALVVYLVLWEIGDLHFTPAAMGFFSGHASRSGNASRGGGLVMASWFLTIFAGNLFAGFYGAWWGTIAPASFWLIAAGVTAVSLPLLLSMRRDAKGPAP